MMFWYLSTVLSTLFRELVAVFQYYNIVQLYINAADIHSRKFSALSSVL